MPQFWAAMEVAYNIGDIGRVFTNRIVGIVDLRRE